VDEPEELPRQFAGTVQLDTGGMMTAALNFGLPSPINIQVEGNNPKSPARSGKVAR
jgi:hypothetical protein